MWKAVLVSRNDKQKNYFLKFLFVYWIREGSTEPEVMMTAESEEDDSSEEDDASDTKSDASDDTDFSPPNQPPIRPNGWNWTLGSNFQPTRLAFDAWPCGFTFDLPG